MKLLSKFPCRFFRQLPSFLSLAAAFSLLAGLMLASAPALAADEPPSAAAADSATPAAEAPASDKKPGGFSVEVPQTPTPKNPVPIGYIREMTDHPKPASRVDVEPSDAGIAGAKLANDENNAGGQFTGEFYSLDVSSVASPDQAVEAAQKLIDLSLIHI